MLCFRDAAASRLRQLVERLLGADNIVPEDHVPGGVAGHVDQLVLDGGRAGVVGLQEHAAHRWRVLVWTKL